MLCLMMEWLSFILCTIFVICCSSSIVMIHIMIMIVVVMIMKISIVFRIVAIFVMFVIIVWNIVHDGKRYNKRFVSTPPSIKRERERERQ